MPKKHTPQPPLIKKAQETETGGAKTYTVGGVEKTRAQVVREVEAGQHEGYHTVVTEGTKYVRSNPDDTKRDNVDTK